MSSPIPEFSFAKPKPRRPINLGTSSSFDSSNFSETISKNSPLPHTTKELNRLQAYGLDIINDDDEAMKLLTDEKSPFYATNKARKLKHKALLPYKTETIRDQYKYLSHIIAHIYIAVKSLDLKGNLTISIEDLESARNIILNNQDQNAYINSNSTMDGQKFETLHSNESEAIEDDDNEEDSDYYESSEDEDDEDAANSTPIMKIEKESASIIALKYWTKELKNLLKMGLVIPLQISIKLIKVFYSICLSRGQTIDILFYTQAIGLLSREKKLLIKNGLELDWEPVYEEFASTLGNPTVFGPSMRDGRFKKLISFALTVKPFFNQDSAPLIMEKIILKCTPPTISATLTHFTVLLPMSFKQPVKESDGSVSYDKKDIRYYLPVLFDLWVNYKSDKEINCLLTVIMNIAVENLKKGASDNLILNRGIYGIFTKEQFAYMMNQLFLSSQIRHKDNRMIKYCKLICQIIINSLSTEYAFEKEGVLDFFKTYADAVYTMIHPSNSGPWSSVLSEVVKKIALSLHLRVQGEKDNRDLIPLYHPDYRGLPEGQKLNQIVIKEVVKVLLPLIHLGAQSKSSSHRRNYNEALQVLCFMEPNMVLDNLLTDWYASFESINSTHRIPIVINQLTHLARLMVELPVYRVHIPRLLSMLLPAIDSNDPEKTILATDFITIVSSVIPFADLTEGLGDGGVAAVDFTSQHLAYLDAKFYKKSPVNIQFGEQQIPDEFQYEAEFELIALKSATSSFKEFLTQFCDNCFKFLELGPAIDTNNTIESQACALISYCFESLVEATSEELYNVISDKFFEYVTNNVKHEVALVFCNIAEAIVRRDPKPQLKRIMDFFMPHIITEIEHGAGISRSQEVLHKDQRLIWNMRIVSGAISGASEEILPYLPDLEKFLILHTYKLKGTAGLCAAMIANCTLSTISYLKPVEKRIISDKWLEDHGGKYSEECWGGFQFSDTRFDLEYLNYKWYVPTNVEVDAAAEHFENLSSSSMEYINRIVDKLNGSIKLSLDEVDQLSFHVELLEGLLKGVCCLFDQSYNENLESKHLQKFKPLLANDNGISSSPSLVNIAKSDSISSLNIEVLKNNSKNVSDEGEKLMNNAKLNGKNYEKDDNFLMEDEISDINPINREIEIEIKRSNSPSGGSIFSNESEIPTRSATPNLSESIDAVDPTLTKRADILFSYGPYFSNDISKALDFSYKKLHSTRQKIGNSLHNLINALSNSEGYIELIGKVIQCISTWLNDCGYYSNDNELYTDNLHFISMQDFPGVFAPYTRSVLGSRLAVSHCSRISISCCTRLPTKLDKVLIKDLVSLIASSYGITATHAASVLGTSLNRVMNCTSAIFNIFNDWEKAITNKDKDVLINIMIMFDKKKLRGLVEKSSSMLPKYEELLYKSAALNEDEVTIMSMRLFRSIKKYVKIPAAVCIFDEKLIECIRPPDADVDMKISVLKLAKSRKKAMLHKILSNLVNSSIDYLSKKLNWKFMLLILELITTIQSHIEIPLEQKTLSTMLKFVNGSHPEISKKGMFWIASIFDTVESRAYNNYDLDNMLSVNQFDPCIVPFNSVAKENTAEEFFKEVKDTKNPKFFIDNKQWIPSYPWDKNLRIVVPINRTGFNFNNNDELAIREFSSYITKDWLSELLKTHIDESEATSAFFPGIVYFFTSITSLIIYGYVDNLTLKDLFDLTDEIFKGDERPTHVAISEVFCGVLFACKNDKESMKLVDEEISKRLTTIFDKHLSQSTFKMWSIFSWWLSGHFDIRRTPKILSLICDFEVHKDYKGSPFGLMCRLSFLKSYIGSVTNRFHDFDHITHKLFKILGHPYDIISSEVSAILFDILHSQTVDYIDSFEEYMRRIHEDKTGMGSITRKQNVLFHEHFKHFLLKTITLAKDNDGKLPQDVVESEFMFYIKGANGLLLRILRTTINVEIVDYIRQYILPLVSELDKVKEACNLSNISIDTFFLVLGSIRFEEQDNDTIIELLESNMGWSSPNLTQYKHSLAFFGVYGTVSFLERTPAQRKKLMEITCSMLFNEHLYLREQYSQNIKLFVHLFLDSEREEMIKFCIKKFKRIIKKNKNNKNVKLTVGQNNLVHGATLGLCALVETYPYTTPPPEWLPEVLTILEVKCTGYSGAIGRAAKDALSQFKKTRQDTWHIDSKFFTEEQLEDLEGVLYKSYYL
ncbi:Blm10 protein [Pichia kluyveri]|uniref:Blm10 protein n=1 Tax=Pichia kluyveri TaxID=36015 RepID=A0AAV5QYD0_PICKL|nr:Blm10 protein [Pichia kluyveri]